METDLEKGVSLHSISYVNPLLVTSMKLRSGQYSAPVKLDVAELAVDVVDMLSEVLPTVELEVLVESALDEIPGGALLDGELVMTELVLAVAVIEVATTIELETPELVFAVGTDDAGAV